MKECKEILLSQGKVALVDVEDYDELSKYKWYAYRDVHTYYAGRNVKNACQVRMHRQITHCPEGLEVDHINRNGLDNRKENLRICTRSQNCCNFVRKRNVSGCRGVVPHGPGKWQVFITKNKASLTLGTFDTFEEAVRVRKDAELKFHGDFVPKVLL